MKDNKSHGQSERQRIIVRTSLFGIGANLLLAAVKAVVGLLSLASRRVEEGLSRAFPG